tara:strand:- start:108 stop:956 length:849 start_codon:yes stop_codon:yes gene_type:complete
MKNLILKILKKLGYTLKGIKPTIKNNDFYSIVKFLLENKKNIHTYFDIGANKGQSIEIFKKMNVNSQIHSFEPTLELYKGLIEKYKNDKTIKINNIGVGKEKDKLTFYSFNKASPVNSFSPMDKKSKFYKARLYSTSSNDSNFTSQTKINVTSVDSYCNENNIEEIDFMKIDTQGFEEEVLMGSKKMLREQKIGIIQLEIIFGFAYEKQSSLFKIEENLYQNGYRCIAVTNSGNILSWSAFQSDFLYVKKDIFDYIKKIHEENEDIKGVTKSIKKQIEQQLY